MPMPAKFSPEEELDIMDAYRQGEAAPRLATQHGCHQQTILNVLARHGAKSRDRRGVSKRAWTKSQLAEIDERWLAGEARTSLAKRFNCGIEAISRVLSVDLGQDATV